MTTSSRQHIFLRLAAIAAVVFGVFLMALPASAGRFIASPPKFDFVVTPGASIRDAVLFTNKTGFDIEMHPEVLNFTYKEGDEITGSPETYPEGEVRRGTEMASWVEMSKEPVLVPAGESHSFSYTITVPEDAQPGGHFGMVQLIAQQPGQESGVGVTGGTGSLIFMRVEGDVTEELNVEQFHTDKYSYRHLPVHFTLRMENEGNTHLRPVGNIFITDMLGRQVAALSVNPQFKAILPGSARRFDEGWSKARVSVDASALEKELKNFAFGKHEATLFLNYGDGKTVSKTAEFWVMPWLALATWIGIAVVAILVLVFGLKAYNRSIIKKYEKKSSK